ncbi:MAG: hypothetical protein FWC96_10240, partial [Oscillospiraceae bacterium]|nr:hypothetical protein [Oscillospiraceae bacterium]
EFENLMTVRMEYCSSEVGDDPQRRGACQGVGIRETAAQGKFSGIREGRAAKWIYTFANPFYRD